eukprot:gene6271-6509_t
MAGGQACVIPHHNCSSSFRRVHRELVVADATSSRLLHSSSVPAKPLAFVDPAIGSAVKELELCAQRAARPLWPAKQKAAFLQQVQSHAMIGDQAPLGVYFLAVQCGTWKGSYPDLQAVAGQPARGLLCLFEVPYVAISGKRCEGQGIDHFMFQLDVEGCFPSGAEFTSGSAFEKLTSKFKSNQFTVNCHILHQGQPVYSVHRWLKQNLPEHKPVTKVVARSSFLGGPPARVAPAYHLVPSYTAASTAPIHINRAAGVRNMPVSLGYGAAVQVAELALKAGNLELMKAVADGANLDHISKQAAADIDIACKLLLLLERIAQQLPVYEKAAAAKQAGGGSAESGWWGSAWWR